MATMVAYYRAWAQCLNWTIWKRRSSGVGYASCAWCHWANESSQTLHRQLCLFEMVHHTAINLLAMSQMRKFVSFVSVIKGWVPVNKYSFEYFGSLNAPLNLKLMGNFCTGYATQTGTILLDVSNLKDFSVSADKSSVTFGAGYRLGELSLALYTQANSLIPAGTCPWVGTSGHILGERPPVIPVALTILTTLTCGFFLGK